MSQQVFLARFELVVARFGPRKVPKCLENGLFWDKKMVQKWDLLDEVPSPTRWVPIFNLAYRYG